MMPTNKKLFKRFDESKVLGEDEIKPEVGMPSGESTKELILKWSNMNIIRGFMPLVGAVLGVWVSV